MISSRAWSALAAVVVVASSLSCAEGEPVPADPPTVAAGGSGGAGGSDASISPDADDDVAETSSGGTGGDGPDGSAGSADGAAGDSSDAPISDSNDDAADAEPDVVAEAGPDVVQDVSTDVPLDVTPDTAADVTVDAPLEAGPEAGSDATVDSASGCVVKGCLNGSENRAGCMNARTIGRTVASTVNGYTTSGTTCTASADYNDATCTGDNGLDHAYRIFVLQGESVSVTVTPKLRCDSNFWEALTFVVSQSTGCDDTSCSVLKACDKTISGPHTKVIPASTDGWVTIVVDGPVNTDAGQYDLNVKLTCVSAGCGC